VKRASIISIILTGIFLAWAWHQSVGPLTILIPESEATNNTEASKPLTSQTYGIKDLPCFKCHIYERFVQEPSTGFFSHALHVQFEYHCNQCHSFRGHRQMVINSTICTFCHDSVPELKKR
jgi:hypothetical protein